MKRITGLDALRGAGILGVLFLHFSLYRYGGLMEIDFSDPPTIVKVIGFALMWAGLFAVVSGAALGIKSMERAEAGAKVLRPALARALAMLVVSYLYFLVFGPGLVHFETKSIDYGILPSLVNFGEWRWPTAERLLYLDSLGMIAFNLGLVGLVLAAILPKGAKAGTRHWLVLELAGLAWLAASLARIPLYEAFAAASARGETWSLLGLNFLVNKNNPLLPYVAFGIFGAAAAVASRNGVRAGKIVNYALGALMAVGGMALYVLWPDTMLARAVDETWFFLMVFQCGLFLLVAQAVLDAAYARARKRADAVSGKPGPVVAALSLYGRAGLTAFVVEPVTTAAVGRALDAIAPGWNADIGTTMAVGAIYAALWGLALLAWKRANFAFGADWLLDRGAALLGSPSSRLEGPGRAERPAG